MIASFEFARRGARRIAPFAACVWFVFAGCSGKEPEPVGTASGGSAASTAGGSAAAANGGVPSAGGAGGAPGTAGPACVSYADGFLPQVHQPVCSNCHGVRDGLPDLGVAATARSECSRIGDLVRRGVMPPDGSGYVLTEGQRSLVADWVALGCPETAAEAAGSCSSDPLPGNGGTPGETGGAPAAQGVVAIERADWDPDDEELRIEGTVDDAQATLTAEFTGRTEPVPNDEGRFRAEFTGVPVRPPSVTVRASSGASATAAVIAQ